MSENNGNGNGNGTAAHVSVEAPDVQGQLPGVGGLPGVGERVRARRGELGWTLAVLAGRVGVAKSYLSMVENRRVANPPSRKVLDALEAALELPRGELVDLAQWERAPGRVRSRVRELERSVERGRELARWLRERSGAHGGAAWASQEVPLNTTLDMLYRSGQLQRQVERGAGRRRGAEGGGRRA